MKISSLSSRTEYKPQKFNFQNNTTSTNVQYNGVSYSDLDSNFFSDRVSTISFAGDRASVRRVPDIDYFTYNSMSPNMKKFLRKKCVEFNKEVNAQELKNEYKTYLPLMDDRIMSEFVKVCDLYRGLKNEPILCLGRSPKWFLNTALWMKDGIDDYKFVAFSKYWFRNSSDGLVRMDRFAPTEEEKKAYKRYLKSIQADPKHIVDVHQKTGKKIVITDYINTGKGVCSFLDLMSEIAEEDGVLEQFAKSIRIFGIGCMEYTEKSYYDDEEVSEPSVQLPDRLMPYKKEIPQEFHDMPLDLFEQMLVNENTNECRSSFYPHEAWIAYKPNRFRTGMLSDKKINELKGKNPRCASNFTPAMRDYRNLLNFRILDYLSENNLLRENLNSKQWD